MAGNKEQLILSNSLFNQTYTEFFASDQNGAVFIVDANDPNIQLLMCRCFNNSLTSYGQDIYAGVLYDADNSCVLSLNDSSFSDNRDTASGTANKAFGGAVALLSGATIKAAGSTFRNNTVNGNLCSYGGAFYCDDGSTLSIQNCRLTGNSSNNTAKAYGGAVALGKSGTVKIINSFFSENLASGASNFGHGGAVSSEGGMLSISGSTFSGNRTESNKTNGGGAILNKGGTATIIRTLFDGNTAKEANQIGNYGGAILNTGTISITGCTFANNSAPIAGGLMSAGTMIVADSLFDGNTATRGKENGGAIKNSSGQVTISGSTFRQSSDTIVGGGIDSIITFSGNNFLGADLSGTGVFRTETGAATAFINAEQISAASIDFASGNSVIFSGIGQVVFSNQDLSGVAVVVNSDLSEVPGSRTIASGLTGIGTISLSGSGTSLAHLAGYTDGVLTLDTSDTLIIDGVGDQAFHYADIAAARQDFSDYTGNIAYTGKQSVIAGGIGDGREVNTSVSCTVTGNVYGGSESGSEDGDINLSVTASAVVGGNLYGAGRLSGGTVRTVISGGEFQKNIYGGGLCNQGTSSLTGTELTISGGTCCNIVIGGSRVSVTGGNSATHAGGNVSLNISGGEFNEKSSHILAAGYIINDKDNSMDAAVLNVSGSTLTLAGTTVAKYVFGGAFAGHGFADVDAVAITVNSGSYQSLFGGGWAQNNGKVTVKSSTVTVAGGSIHNLYAGGTDGGLGNQTSVTASVLTIAGGTVDNIFLNGKFSRDTVTDSVLNITGECTVNWIEGLSHTMLGSAENTTMNLYSSLTAADILHIKYWHFQTAGASVDFGANTADLNGNNDLQMQSILDFHIEEALPEEWVALTARAIEGLSDDCIKINGITATRNGNTWAADGYAVSLALRGENRYALVVSGK